MTAKLARDKSKAEEIKEAKRMATKYEGSYIGFTLGIGFVDQVIENTKNDSASSLYDVGRGAGIEEKFNSERSDLLVKVGALDREVVDERIKTFEEVSELKHQINRKDVRIAELEDNISTYMEEVEILNQSNRDAQKWNLLKNMITDLIK